MDDLGVAPHRSVLKDLDRDKIIVSAKSWHAAAWTIGEAPKLSKDIHILVDLSGRDDQDPDDAAEKFGLNFFRYKRSAIKSPV